MLEFDSVCLIRPKGSNGRPMVVGLRGEWAHWSAGFSHGPWEPDKYDVVRTYEGDEDGVDMAYEELQRDFAPQPQEPCARMGFIAPTGEFYPCAYCAHNDLEAILNGIYQLYGSLDTKGWLVVKGGYATGSRLVTQAQKDTYRRVVEAFEDAERKNPDVNWNKELLENPEWYSVQTWFTPPHDRAGSFAGQLRQDYELLECVDPTAQPAPEKLSQRRDAHPGD
ncbi:MAG: hypothetical protein JSS66_06485 [Armatimonadetes bacterium]|nr:hypothetical protein [Armatimonadota bacterium]